MTEIEILRKLLDEIFIEYCDEVVKTENCFTGTAFFPGGNGIYKPETNSTFPKHKIMVLGQDFGTEEYIERAKLNKNVDEVNSPTWNNLKKIFDEAGIEMADCFFTNAIMGVRKAKSMIGKSPAFNKNNDVFLLKCNLYFQKQVEIQKPKLIIALGFQVYIFLCKYFPGKLVNSYIQLDENGLAYIKDVEINGLKTNILFMTHPSLYYSNVKNRKYKNFEGKESSIAMLKDAINESLIN